MNEHSLLNTLHIIMVFGNLFLHNTRVGVDNVKLSSFAQAFRYSIWFSNLGINTISARKLAPPHLMCEVFLVVQQK